MKDKEEMENQNKILVEKLERMTEGLAETEDLKRKLEANKTIMINNDEMLRNVELELEEARAELAKRQVETTTTTVLQEQSSADHQQQLEEKDQTIEKLQSDFEQLKKELVRKEKLLLQNDEDLADTRYKLLEREKQERSATAVEVKEVTEKLQAELKKAQDQKAVLEEQLEHAKRANEKHLIELATHREKARDTALDLEESKAEVEEVRTSIYFRPLLFF